MPTSASNQSRHWGMTGNFVILFLLQTTAIPKHFLGNDHNCWLISVTILYYSIPCLEKISYTTSIQKNYSKLNKTTSAISSVINHLQDVVVAHYDGSAVCMVIWSCSFGDMVAHFKHLWLMWSYDGSLGKLMIHLEVWCLSPFRGMVDHLALLCLNWASLWLIRA